MEAVRIILSMVFTAFGSSIVVGTIWFLFESRQERVGSKADLRNRLQAQLLAVFIASFTGGLLLSQFFSLITARYYPGATTPTAFFPMAVIAGVFIMIGAAGKAWLLRPRRAPTWVWLGCMVVVAGLLILIRLVFL